MAQPFGLGPDQICGITLRFETGYGIANRDGTASFLAGASTWDFNTPIGFAAGSAAAPSIAFTLDPDTGLYNTAANTLSVTAGGAERLRVGEALYVRGTAPIPFAENVAIASLADADATLSDAQHRGTIVTVAAGANNRTLTTRTAAQLVAAFPGAQVGTMIPLRICNLKAANTVTLAGDASVTAAAGVNLVVAAQTAATFALVFTNVTAASEAVSIVRVAG